MGCGGHSKVILVNTIDEKYMDLTDQQVELVRASWCVVQDNLLENGLIIYDNFLRSLESEVLRLFSKIIYSDENEQKLIVHEEMLQRHAMLVMQGIGTAVDSLDEPSRLQVFLAKVGETHYRNDVDTNMLERLWPAIDDSFRTVLSDVYGKEVRDSWHKVIKYMIYKMKEAMVQAKMRDSNRKNSENEIKMNDP